MSRILRPGIRKLEIVLVIAFILLILQLLPGLFIRVWAATRSGLDVRTWSRSSWVIANVSILSFLIAVRYAPDIATGFRSARFAWLRRSRRRTDGAADIEYVERCKRDEEWRSRAKNRLPFQ
jgi:hypothetical protein